MVVEGERYWERSTEEEEERISLSIADHASPGRAPT
jgi:hypothetical protein